MANFNRIILIGRLTRDPETRTFANGGKVAKFGFAASPSRKKDPATGKWEDEPMFIDCEVFNRGEKGTLANTVEQFCRKGTLIAIEGKLHLDQWDDKSSGQKRQKHKVIVDSVQLLERREDGNGRSGGGGGYSRPSGASGGGRPAREEYDDGGNGGEEIPF